MDLPPPPPIEVVETIEHDDLFNQNPISKWVFEVIEAVPGETFDQKELNALERHLPTNAADLHLIFQFDGRWGNGGMQAIILHDDPEYTLKFLELVSEAFRRQGCQPCADYVGKLREKTVAWTKTAKELEGTEGAEEDWEKLWGEIDAEDDSYDNLTQESPSPYETIANVLKANPKSFIETKTGD